MIVAYRDLKRTQPVDMFNAEFNRILVCVA